MSKQPEHISESLKRIFGGYKLDGETLAKVWQYRQQHLPSTGYCQPCLEIIPKHGFQFRQGRLSLEALKEICRQINNWCLRPSEVCRHCTYQECAIKTTMDFPT